jgi:bifunctional lysine-specific demethylase and histidyl-hydroxylase MINA
VAGPTSGRPTFFRDVVWGYPWASSIPGVQVDDGADLFAWLLDPLSTAEFERTFYQKKVLVVPRQAPRYYSELLSVEELDRVLGTHASRFPDLSIVQTGRDIPSSQYTEGDHVVDPVRAARLFAEGATLVFSQLHNRVPPLARLCTTLGRLFSSRMQTNIYLTPPNAQGFDAHWDTHDVFVLQVSGSKRWTIYDTPITLPLRGQEFDPAKHKPADPTLEFELKAGDMAYIPRGAYHSARSTDEVSLHVTTGLIAFTWTDLFLQGIAAAAEKDVALRENLPFGFEDARFSAEEKARLLQEKLALLAGHVTAHPPFDYLAGEVMAKNRPCLTDLLTQVSRMPALTITSTVRRRPDARWDVEENEATCVVRCYGNRIELPRFVAPALAFVRQSRGFRVGDLPDCIDGDGKVTLVRRLVKEGILESVETGA